MGSSLVVTADGFEQSAVVTRRIIAAHENAIVMSASLAVLWRAW